MEQSSKPRVLVSVLHQGWVRPELTKYIVNLSKDPRVHYEIMMTNLKPSENNRNNAVRAALTGGYDYLFTIDHDIVPLRDMGDLVLLDLDVVGMACPQWNMSDPSFPVFFVGMDKVEGGYQEHKDRNGLQEVDAVGSGALLIARRVLEKVKEPFVRKWEKGFAVVGLDFYFSEKAKKQGFKVYCHYDYITDHIKEISLLDVLNFKNG